LQEVLIEPGETRERKRPEGLEHAPGMKRSFKGLGKTETESHRRREAGLPERGNFLGTEKRDPCGGESNFPKESLRRCEKGKEEGYVITQETS